MSETKGKLRRNREFEDDGSVASQLPSAESPHSRAVSSEAELPPEVIDARGIPLTPALKLVSGEIICGNSESVLAQLDAESITCAITSPPYWNLVDYGCADQIGGDSYAVYRERLTAVWKQVARVLKPNGKFALNVPIMPVTKAVSAQAFGKTHTRWLLDLPGDLKADILGETDLIYYSLYIWEKQTTEKMFGSYPYPPNLLERNYCEFILVFVKPGKPTKHPQAVKDAAKLTQEQWMDLTKQLWWIYPENVKRKDGHPSPFPEALPNRLINMYTFPRSAGFAGDVVLDPFAGWGTTCVAAKKLGRRFIGIDLSPAFCAEAHARTRDAATYGVVPTVLPATKPAK